MRLIQREGAAGAVPFVGDAARLLFGDEVIADWQTGGLIADVPQGRYTLETRRGQAVRAEEVAVGVVVAAMGQSNIQRWFRNPSAEGAPENAFQLRAGRWLPVDGPGGRAFAGKLSGALGLPVGIFNAAVGGAPLMPEADKGRGHWLDEAEGTFYDRARAMLQTAGGRVELVLWMQGETDAALRVPLARYRDGLCELFARIARDFGQPTIVIGELGPHLGSAGRLDDLYDGVRETQREVAAMLDHVHIGATTIDLPLVDNVHLTPESYAVAGSRMAESAAALLRR